MIARVLARHFSNVNSVVIPSRSLQKIRSASTSPYPATTSYVLSPRGYPFVSGHTSKTSVPETPVFANTGCRVNTIREILQTADGAVVGTTFKIDGKFENLTDESRVKEFMDIVKDFRK